MPLIKVVSCWCLVLQSVASAFKQEATPVQKVVKLLKKFEADVTAEGKKEAAEFKAYAKFCAKSIDEKEYQIGRSQKDISRMKADMGVVTQDIRLLEEEIATLNNDTASFKEQLETAAVTRAEEAINYSAKAKMMSESITALEKAMQAVKAGKGSSAGLAQVTAMASRMLSSASQVNLIQLTSAQTNALGALAAPTASSNAGIIDTLRHLKADFAKNKHDLDMDEENAKFTFNKIQLDMTNRLKFAKEDVEGKTSANIAKEGRKAQLDKDLVAENASLNSDESFLQELKTTCADKATAAEERKPMRAGELEALGKAIAQLTEDVSFLQAQTEMPIRNHLRSQLQAGLFPKQDKPTKMAAVRSAEPGSGSSFLQRRTTSSNLENKMAKLEAMSTRVNVPLFSLAVLKVKAANAADPYASIRTVIKNLVSDLESSSSNAASVKSQCDTIEGANKKDMAESQKEIDELLAEIDSNEAFLARESKSAAELEKDISELKENIAEAEKLRAAEKSGNDLAIKEAKAGELAATNAKNTLSAYYEASPGSSSADFLQVSQPKVTTADYNGETTQRSSGVLGLLDIVISDFQNAKTKTENEETKAASEYDAFKSKSNSDISSKETELETKSGEISAARVKLLESKGALENQEEINKKAKQALEASKAMCAPESFEARKAARDKSIASLKDILVELEDMIAAERSR